MVARGGSDVVSLLQGPVCIFLSSVLCLCSQSVAPLLVESWLVANSPASAMLPGMPRSAFPSGCCGLLNNPWRPAEIVFYSHTESSPNPSPKQTQPLPGAFRTCNEKQVSPGDLSARHCSLGSLPGDREEEWQQGTPYTRGSWSPASEASAPCVIGDCILHCSQEPEH